MLECFGFVVRSTKRCVQYLLPVVTILSAVLHEPVFMGCWQLAVSITSFPVCKSLKCEPCQPGMDVMVLDELYAKSSASDSCLLLHLCKRWGVQILVLFFLKKKQEKILAGGLWSLLITRNPNYWCTVQVSMCAIYETTCIEAHITLEGLDNKAEVQNWSL